MAIYHEKRAIKPGAWGDSLLQNVSLSRMGEAHSTPRTSGIVIWESREEDVELQFTIHGNIELPNEASNNCQLAGWLFSTQSTERNHKLLFKIDCRDFFYNQKQAHFNIQVGAVYRGNYKIRLGIIEKRGNVPGFIAGERIYRLIFQDNLFPTAFTSFRDRGWPPHALWFLDYENTNSPDDMVYQIDGKPNIVLNINKDLPNLVRLTESSAARDKAKRLLHRTLINEMTCNALHTLLGWIVEYEQQLRNEKEYVEPSEGSIRYAVVTLLSKKLEIKNTEELVPWGENSETIRVKIQHALGEGKLFQQEIEEPL